MEYLFGILKLFFPFFKETFFGEKNSSSEYVGRNRLVGFLLMCLIVVFIFYYHNAYKFDEVIGANSTLAQEVAVLQANLHAADQTNTQLQTDLSIARARLATSQPIDNQSESTSPKKKIKHRR